MKTADSPLCVFISPTLRRRSEDPRKSISGARLASLREARDASEWPVLSFPPSPCSCGLPQVDLVRFDLSRWADPVDIIDSIKKVGDSETHVTYAKVMAPSACIN